MKRLLTAALVLFVSLNAFAMDKEVLALVKFETEANAVSERNPGEILMEHFEIPYDMVEKEIAEGRVPKELLPSLTFQKNGQTFIRWVINPEDTKWNKDVEKWLAKKGIPVVKGKYFKGHQTASRSYIVEDPKSGFQFSVKVSTDRTGGNWTDKKQTWEDGWQIRMVTDFVAERLKAAKAQTIVLLDEPATFGIKDIDQGMVIRALGNLGKDGNMYLPGFSALHEEVGAEIARKNGAKDIAQFWNDNYSKPLAKALAELFAYTGITYDSPHSQNFLVELDANMRPTGRIVLRDLGDVYLWQDYFEAAGRPEICKKWEADNVIKGDFSIGVGLLHGNRNPSWLTLQQYQGWAADFYQVFDAHFAEITGVPVGEIAGRVSLPYNFSYANKVVPGRTAAMKAFLAKIPQTAAPNKEYGGSSDKKAGGVGGFCKILFGKAS